MFNNIWRTRGSVVSRTLLLSGLALHLGTGSAAAQSQAENFPTRPITLVVGYAPGGMTDVIARKLATRLGAVIGQPVVVLNREGAGTTIAYRHVADARPDGYTIMFGGGSGHAIAPLLMKVPYDSLKDFRAVSLIYSSPITVSVHPSVPAHNLKELASLIHKHPGKYSYASGGVGGIDHLTGELFKQSIGAEQLLHVPFKGGAPAATAVIGNQVPILMNGLGTVNPYAQNGQLRLLAVAAPKRAETAPDIPTSVESGYPDFIAEGYASLVVPSKTPDHVVKILSAAVSKAMNDPQLIKELKEVNVMPLTDSTPESADRYIRKDAEKWARVVKEANIKID